MAEGSINWAILRSLQNWQQLLLSPRGRWLAAMIAALAISMIHGLTVGAMSLSTERIWAALITSDASSGISQAEIAIVWDIRLPRLVLAALVGAVLSLSGAALQSVFRNPLADPGLIGVSSGAALAAGVVIVLGGVWTSSWSFTWAAPLMLPISAFIGALLATFLVVHVGRLNESTSMATVLLAGIALNAIAVAGIGLLSYVADDQALRDLTFWTLGSVSRAGWDEILWALPLLLLPIVLIPRLGTALNALLLGEVQAGHLGVRVERLKRLIFLCVTLGVGAAVALTGIIAFVGLIVPHVLRLWLGPDNEKLLVASTIGGAILLVVADTLSRTLVAPAELPVGILTSLVGGPFFLFLIGRYRRQVSL